MSTTRPVRTMSRSQALFERAQAHLAGGVGSGTRSPRAGWAPVPLYVAEASGSHVTDVDGTTYVDYQMGQGPLILGHRPPRVLAAVTPAINERGSHLALCHELEGEAAAAVAARVPSIELLRFGNSGTECVQYALRFARAATGRRLIVRFEGHYHGWSDAIHFSAHPAIADAGPAGHPHAVPGSTGMAGEVAGSLLILPWNDVAAVEAAFAEHGDDIAAVITEPIMGNGGGILPAPGYLERLREVTRAAGSLLIFDEVLTGFRVGPGGAQALFGIEPDLTVLAKAVGARLPRRGRRRHARGDGGRQRGPHDARRHLQLEPDRVRGGARDDAGDGPRGLLRRARRTQRAARRGPRRGRAGGGPRGLHERHGRAVPALVRRERRRPTTGRRSRSSSRAPSPPSSASSSSAGS